MSTGDIDHLVAGCDVNRLNSVVQALPTGGALAPRAAKRRPICELFSHQWGPTSKARLTFAAVCRQTATEVAARSVHVDIERIKRGTTLCERLCHYLAGVFEQFPQTA